MITPTVGRVVWFFPADHGEGLAFRVPQPLSASVAYVWNDRLINIGGFDADGHAFSRTSVPLLQDDDLKPEGGFCAWMPYQKGQAAKYEALEAQKSA
jgi:hypothetical protein